MDWEILELGNFEISHTSESLKPAYNRKNSISNDFEISQFQNFEIANRKLKRIKG